MEALADQAREADVEALLAITDELQAIDEELERIAQNARGPARLAMLRPVRVPEEGRDANAVVERRRQFRLPT